jgi:hypothetical protein
LEVTVGVLVEHLGGDKRDGEEEKKHGELHLER